jgi:hypothetical protein
MIPDAQSIVRKRYRMRKTIRVASVALWTLAVLNFFEYLAVVLITDSMSVVTYSGSFVFACATTGGVLLLAQRWLVRWLVPWPRPGCPACGYSLDGVPKGELTTRCPECGIDLGPEGAEPFQGADGTTNRD